MFLRVKLIEILAAGSGKSYKALYDRKLRL